METARIGDLTLGYHRVGRGPAALLIHGFPFDHRLWLDTVGLLAGGRTVIAPDLRGRGGSSPTKLAVHSMEVLAGDLADLLAVLGMEPVDVIGHSMGGYVALGLAEAHPRAIRSLTLVASRASADGEAARAGRDSTIAGVLEHGRGWLADQLLPRLLAAGASAAVRGRARTMIEATPYEAIIADLAGMRDRSDRTSILAGLEAPKLVVAGGEDALIPHAEAEALAEATGARLATVHGAGHLLPMEAPRALVEALED